MKKILKNLLIAISVISYFMILVLANTRMGTERLSNDIKVFAVAFLVISILVIEKAYKKDSGKTAITGIELLVLSFYSLSIMHMVNIFKCDFSFYLIISSIIAGSYYIIKGIIIYTKDRKEYLNQLSDISEIVKEEPVKKEAKKRSDRKGETKGKVDNKQKDNVEIKKEIKTQNKNIAKNKKTQNKKSSSAKKASTTTKSGEIKKASTASKKGETKKVNTANKKVETKNANVASKKTETKKTIQTKEKSEAELEIKRKKTTKSKKEVEEND